MNMKEVLINLTDDEIMHVYLAVCKAINNNDNGNAVIMFENILTKLDPYVSDITKMTGSIMKQF